MSGSISQEQFSVTATLGGLPSSLGTFVEIEGKSAGVVDLPFELSMYAPGVYKGTLVKGEYNYKPCASIEIEGKMITVDFPPELVGLAALSTYTAVLTRCGG